jgi:putative acetyltransferase
LRLLAFRSLFVLSGGFEIVMIRAVQNVLIRDESASDIPAIRETTELAFHNAAHTCGREHLLVDALRNANALTLSLVAVAASGAVVGHVAVSPVTVGGAAGGWFGFGPLSVLPQLQKQGIGSCLVKTALDRLRAQGARGCVLVGDPAYYVRFGFKSDPLLVMPGVPPEVVLSLRFQSGSDGGDTAFHPAFLAALTGTL